MQLFQSLSLLVLLSWSHFALSQNEGRWYNVEILIFKRVGSEAYTREIWRNNIELQYPENYQYLLGPEAENFSKIDKEQQLLETYRVALQKKEGYSVLFHEAWKQQMLGKEDSVGIIVNGGERVGEHTELSGYIKLHIARYLHLNSDLWLITDDDPVDTHTLDTHILDNKQVTEQTGNYHWNNPDEFDDTIWPSIPRKPLANTFKELEGNPENRENQELPWDLSYLGRPNNYPIATLRSTRRMRSNELHYLDHPLMGLLILITPLEEAQTQEEEGAAERES